MEWREGREQGSKEARKGKGASEKLSEKQGIISYNVAPGKSIHPTLQRQGQREQDRIATTLDRRLLLFSFSFSFLFSHGLLVRGFRARATRHAV